MDSVRFYLYSVNLFKLEQEISYYCGWKKASHKSIVKVWFGRTSFLNLILYPVLPMNDVRYSSSSPRFWTVAISSSFLSIFGPRTSFQSVFSFCLVVRSADFQTWKQFFKKFQVNETMLLLIINYMTFQSQGRIIDTDVKRTEFFSTVRIVKHSQVRL